MIRRKKMNDWAMGFFGTSPVVIGGANNPTKNPLLVGTPVTNPAGTIGLSTNTAGHWTGFQINSVAPNNIIAGTFDGTGTALGVGTITISQTSGLNLIGSGGATVALSSSVNISGNSGVGIFGLHLNVVIKSGNYTALESSDDIIKCTGAAAFTVTLPTPVNIGKIFIVKNVTSPLATITVTAAASIDGAGSQTLTTAFSSLTVAYDGTTFNIIGKV